MSGRLAGRVAVVTGGANGIGRACCERFAEEGAAVVVADVDEAAGKDVVGVVEAHGREAAALALDAADPAANEALVARTVERFGRVDVLVTAAGVSSGDYRSADVASRQEKLQERLARGQTPGSALAALDLDDWRRVLDVNLTGTVLAVKAVAPVMLAAGRGSIVTIASVAAKRPGFGIPYGVSKAGVWRFTKEAALDLAGGGVRVNAICPGWIATNMTAPLFSTPGAGEVALSAVPMGRVGTPREVADVAVFLAGDESSYVTGELLHPDGGMYTD